MLEARCLEYGYVRQVGLLEFLRRPLRRPLPPPILRDVNLRIPRGSRLAIRGVNGAGKTTLLKLLGGMLYPNRGSVTLDELDTVRDAVRLRAQVGYVINEDRSFYWMLTGRENLEFFAALNGVHGRAARDRIDYYCNCLGLNEAAERRVAEYSSGMRQRLAIARGLLHDPSVFLLDEPTRCLDVERALSVRAFLLDWARADPRRMLLVTTHAEEEVASLCSGSIVVAEGVVAMSSPSAVLVAGHDRPTSSAPESAPEAARLAAEASQFAL